MLINNLFSAFYTNMLYYYTVGDILTFISYLLKYGNKYTQI